MYALGLSDNTAPHKPRFGLQWKKTIHSYLNLNKPVARPEGYASNTMRWPLEKGFSL